MAIPTFAPEATASLAATHVSKRIAIPGSSGTILRVINLGPGVAHVKLGDNTVVVSVPETAMAIVAGQPEYLTIGAATNIAAIASGSKGCGLNITRGA